MLLQTYLNVTDSFLAISFVFGGDPVFVTHQSLSLIAEKTTADI